LWPASLTITNYLLEHVRIALAQCIMEALAADCCVMIGDSPGCARWSFPTQPTNMDTKRAKTQDNALKDFMLFKIVSMVCLIRDIPCKLTHPVEPRKGGCIKLRTSHLHNEAL